MQEISLELAEAYFQDRVKELKAEIPNGTVNLFLVATILLDSLSTLAGKRDIFDYMPSEYRAKKADILLNRLTENGDIGRFFSLDFSIRGGMASGTRTLKLAFTHQNELHLQVQGAADLQKVVIAAEPFLQDIEGAITGFFADAREDVVIKYELLRHFNVKRLFGYGD